MGLCFVGCCFAGLLGLFCMCFLVMGGIGINRFVGGRCLSALGFGLLNACSLVWFVLVVFC